MMAVGPADTDVDTCYQRLVVPSEQLTADADSSVAMTTSHLAENTATAADTAAAESTCITGEIWLVFCFHWIIGILQCW